MQTVEEVQEALRTATPVTSLASLIRVGIEDGRKMLAERPDVRPYYAMWFRTPTLEDGKCTACLAGGVMLGTLAGLSRQPLEDYGTVNSNVLVSLYEEAQTDALCALDRVRQGNIDGAYRALHGWYAPDGKRDPQREAFRADVHRLCDTRRRRTPENRQGPEEPMFETRGMFERHLDSLAELADELERIELAAA